MAFILTCENCRCRQIKFIEQGGELLADGVGKEYVGTIALQTFDDRPDMRITLADNKNVFGGLLKRIILPGIQDHLCHFDFNRSELRSRKKLLKVQVQLYGLSYYIALMCYDFSSHTGASYLLPNFDILKKWAHALNISTYESLDAEGNLEAVKPIAQL